MSKRTSHERWVASFRLAVLWNVRRNVFIYLNNEQRNLNNFSNCNFICNFISGSSEKPTNGHNAEYSESKYLKLWSA